MTKTEFAARLQQACASVTAAEQELTEIEFKRMFAQAKEDFMDVSKAKVGDKTLVDAFYPAVSAIAETEAALKRFWTLRQKLPKKAPTQRQT